MGEQELTAEVFAALMRRAGVKLSPADMAALYDEIAPSCRLVGEMAEHVRTLLAPEQEPTHIFRRGGDHDLG